MAWVWPLCDKSVKVHTALDHQLLARARRAYPVVYRPGFATTLSSGDVSLNTAGAAGH